MTIKVKGGRLRVESSSGNLLGSYPAKPESIGKFLESFWYAEKASSDKPAPAESPKVEAKPAAIDDFGAKLEGARKDAQASMAKEWTDDEIASQPFSKVWPAADIDAIEDPFEAALMFAARAEVPAKPRVAYKVKAWVAKVKMFRDVVLRDIGNLGRDRALDEMSKRSGLSSAHNTTSK